MKIAIFISDEGFGHAMRQKNIIYELIDHIPFIDITVFGKEKMDVIKDEFGDRIKYKDIFNLLITVKDVDGNLDVEKTKIKFKNWKKERDLWISKIIKMIDPKTQLIISDSVPQTSSISKELGIKQLNIQHFTWDWLYKSIYGDDEIFRLLNADYKLNGDFIFPPLTPVGNLNLHNNYQEINFIVNKNLINKASEKNLSDTNKIVLLMNNGTESLLTFVGEILEKMPNQKSWKYLLRSENLSEKSRMIALERNDVEVLTGFPNTHLAIAKSNIVLARGGYNIISELLALQKPSIILEERFNPEISSNLELAKKYSLINIGNRKNSQDLLLEMMHKVDENSFLRNRENIKCHGASEVLLKIYENLS